MFDTDDDNIQWKVKGMRARLTDGTYVKAYNKGQVWIIEKPPGWEELMKSLEAKKVTS